MLQRSVYVQVPAFAQLLVRPRPIKTCSRSLQIKAQSSVCSTRAGLSLRESICLHRSQTSNVSLRSLQAESGSELYLIVYSKPGCHLCDGLKEKIQAVLDKAMFQPSPLAKASLQIRNILDEPEWEKAYGMSIPVMTAIKCGESEEIKIPRAPPKLTADRLHNHIVQALNL